MPGTQETVSGQIIAAIGQILGAAIGLWIISLFTRKELNPQFEKMIEKRMNRVTHLTLLAIGVTIVLMVGFRYLRYKYPALLSDERAVAILPVLMGCWAIFTHSIAQLKGFGRWASLVWALIGASGMGLLVLLICVNYRPIGEPPPFPVYRGSKLTFPCASCGRYVSDHRCNAGTEATCPKCGAVQTVPDRSIRRVRA
jgi:hypothetical protein